MESSSCSSCASELFVTARSTLFSDAAETTTALLMEDEGLVSAAEAEDEAEKMQMQPQPWAAATFIPLRSDKTPTAPESFELRTAMRGKKRLRRQLLQGLSSPYVSPRTLACFKTPRRFHTRSRFALPSPVPRIRLHRTRPVTPRFATAQLPLHSCDVPQLPPPPPEPFHACPVNPKVLQGDRIGAAESARLAQLQQQQQRASSFEFHAAATATATQQQQHQPKASRALARKQQKQQKQRRVPTIAEPFSLRTDTRAALRTAVQQNSTVAAATTKKRRVAPSGPFVLETALRGEWRQERLMQSLQEAAKEESRVHEFHAQPFKPPAKRVAAGRTLQQQQQQPSILMQSTTVLLHSDARAAARREFDEKLEQRHREQEEERERMAQEQHEQEVRQIRELRRMLVHHPMPILPDAVVQIRPSERPLTVPKSPYLLSKRRALSRVSTTAGNSSSLLRI